MTYGIDFRERVVSYVQSGHTRKETCALFGISPNTLPLWEKQLEKEGHLNRKPRSCNPRKLPLDRLEHYVEEHPDAFLREIAEHFNCSIPFVWAALKKVKRPQPIKNKIAKKVRRYLDVLACFPKTPIVYIDETGIDTYLYRHKARAPRGERGYDKASGRRFERISVVVGQIGS